jgi:secondary thiamine-phosphate synthase enzyme
MRNAVRVLHHTLEIAARGRGLHPFATEVARWLQTAEVKDGLFTAFVQHTSASLLIQENADPAVQTDLERFFERLVRDGDPLFEHDAEGPDDMPAHVRAALTQTHLSVPVLNGRMALGTWQGLYLYEHRTSPHVRRVVLSYLGT